MVRARRITTETSGRGLQPPMHSHQSRDPVLKLWDRLVERAHRGVPAQMGMIPPPIPPGMPGIPPIQVQGVPPVAMSHHRQAHSGQSPIISQAEMSIIKEEYSERSTSQSPRRGSRGPHGHMTRISYEPKVGSKERTLKLKREAQKRYRDRKRAAAKESALRLERLTKQVNKLKPLECVKAADEWWQTFHEGALLWWMKVRVPSMEVVETWQFEDALGYNPVGDKLLNHTKLDHLPDKGASLVQTMVDVATKQGMMHKNRQVAQLQASTNQFKSTPIGQQLNSDKAVVVQRRKLMPDGTSKWIWVMQTGSPCHMKRYPNDNIWCIVEQDVSAAFNIGFRLGQQHAQKPSRPQVTKAEPTT